MIRDRGGLNALFIIALIGLLIWLAGCSPNSPIGTGFEGHMPDIPVNPAEEEHGGVLVHVYFLRADEVMQRCHELTGMEAMGCATLFEPTYDADANQLTPSCVVITPNNTSVYGHELQHCFRGHWH